MFKNGESKIYETFCLDSSISHGTLQNFSRLALLIVKISTRDHHCHGRTSSGLCRKFPGFTSRTSRDFSITLGHFHNGVSTVRRTISDHDFLWLELQKESSACLVAAWEDQTPSNRMDLNQLYKPEGEEIEYLRYPSIRITFKLR